MIIASLPQIQNLLAELSSSRLSSLLPVEVLVLKKLSPEKYLLQIKDMTFETTTPKPLDVGTKYLASIAQDTKSNTLFLNHFHKAPLKPEQAIYQLEELISHFKKPSKEAITELHSKLLSTLSNSSSKEEFNFLTQLLLGLNQETVSLPFKYTDGFGLVQYKKKKKQDKQSQDEVQFYAHLQHLGPLDGVVGLNDEQIYIKINVLFEESFTLLQNYKNVFSLESEIHIQLKEEIRPLFVLNDKILDINI
ncbi:hypothetical protein ACFLR3_03130 [Campylobacterota bacterium]